MSPSALPSRVLWGAALGGLGGGLLAKRQLPHAGIGIGGLWPLGAIAGAFLGGLVGGWLAE